MRNLWQDLRHGARGLARTPLATSLAVLTLTLGIGANTAIFSAISGLLLKPWPLPAPDRLVAVSDTSPRRGIAQFPSAPANFDDWRADNRSFTGLAAYSPDRFTLTGGARPLALPGTSVSGNFFSVLGAQPFAGRFFAEADDRPGAEPVAVLSYGTWQSYYGGDPGLIGKRIQIDGRGRTLIGVARRDLNFPERTAIWLPLALDYAHSGRGGHFLSVLGRLRPQVTLPQAQGDMSRIAQHLAQQYPDKDADWGVTLVPLQASTAATVKPALLLLAAAVWIVLLIACANVASLLLARLATRARDLAVRAALGAGRSRLIRLVLAESLVLALASGLLGLALAEIATRSLVTLDPEAIPYASAIGLDGRVLLHSLALSLGTGILVGLVPLASLLRDRIYRTLRSSEPAVVGGSRSNRLRRGLVIGEVALTTALLAAAGLMLRSFAELTAVRPGFDSAGVVTTDLSLPAGKYGTAAEQAQFAQRLVERIRALPGVAAAATVDPLPLSGGMMGLTFSIAGRPRPQGADPEMPSASIVTASPAYFKTLSIPLLAGRTFTEADRPGTEPVALVNRSLARRYWGTTSPLGQRITFSPPGAAAPRWLTIVGVVGDVRAAALGKEAPPQVYWPEPQQPSPELTLVLRSATPPGALVEPLRHAVAALDPDLPLDRVQTLDAVVAASLADRRAETAVLATFGSLALTLAAVGIFGVLSCTVAQRTREIGIRMVLGARPETLLATLLKDAMGPVGLGLLLGLALAWLSGKGIAGRLYGITATDPATFAAVALLLAAVALVATAVPVRRALRKDPLATLRTDEA